MNTGLKMETFRFDAQRLTARLARLLNEGFMGFLALAALATGLTPILFTVSQRVGDAFNLFEWVIVGLFAVEYAVHLALTDDRRAFVSNPWRVIDLIIILTPLVSLFPQVGAAWAWRSSPVLRLLRLGRALLFGARVSGAVIREHTRRETVAKADAAHVTALDEGVGEGDPRPVSWGEFLEWVSDPQSGWYHVSSLRLEQFQEIAQAAGIPAGLLESNLSDASYPRVETSGPYSSLFAWLPAVRDSEHPEADRNGTLLLSNGKSVVTLSRHPTDLQTLIGGAKPHLDLTAVPFATRMIRAFLRIVLDRNEQLAGHLERELRELEEFPVQDSNQRFFEQTFRLKRELSATKADLWRLKGLLSSLAESRLTLHGLGAEHREFLRTLVDEADYLYATVDNIRDGVLSLIELHLNVVSFEMNKVMRVLAVVSLLGLIPAVVGGLFGMNLVDNPWHWTLPQVTFGVVMGMLGCLYIFLVKGWLR